MKRLFILVVVGLLIGGTALFAEQKVLIDFSKLAGDTPIAQGNDADGKPIPPVMENAATMIDFSVQAGASITDDQKKAMKSSLAVEDWGVLLASSARTVANERDSYTREAPSTSKGKVLGVRVHFPTDPYNSWALITPPFDIPAYADKTAPDGLTPVAGQEGLGSKFEDGLGVVKNVGVLKSLSINVYGSNYPNGLGIIVADQDGNQQTLFMENLQFDGWRTLVWQNPNYIKEVRNRELRVHPLYPAGMPYLKFVGLVLYRDAAQPGGDIVAYFKDITITYDLAITEAKDASGKPVARDIEDEKIWQILTKRYEAAKAAEVKRLGNIQVLRFLERAKLDRTPEAGQQPAATQPAKQ